MTIPHATVPTCRTRQFAADAKSDLNVPRSAARVYSKVLEALLLIGLVACGGSNGSAGNSNAGGSGGNDTTDPNFAVVANGDGVLSGYTRKVIVFGVPIYAVPAVSDAKLLHAANVMAQYLDNDEDGSVDNQLVLDTMLAAKAYMVMWKTEADLGEPVQGWEGQDLGDGETVPGFVAGGLVGQFDAALEEVLHLITHVGYAGAYPSVFGEAAGSGLANAMDTARGGYFETIPPMYPAGAWYTYDDATCDYACMATEYHYWALTSLLGAQANRLDAISNEWTLNTAQKVEQTDTAVHALLTNATYRFPTTLPDGTYRQ